MPATIVPVTSRAGDATIGRADENSVDALGSSQAVTSLRAGSPGVVLDGRVVAAQWPLFGLLGRNPARGDRDPAETVLIPVTESRLALSKTHAALGRSESGLWIMDRGSTNGTQVRRSDGTIEDLAPGQRRTISPDETVLLAGSVWLTSQMPDENTGDLADLTTVRDTGRA